MVAQMEKDKGMSTLSMSQFNYGGDTKEFITLEDASSILNFGIVKEPCRTKDGEVIPRMHYLERTDGGIVDANCSVGDEFEVTAQPIELVEFARFIMAKVPEVKIETVATMYNGGTAFINLTQGGSWLVRGDKSPHNTNVLIANPLSRGKIHMVAHSIRVVCQNTLQLGMKTGEGYRICHTTNARQMMERALEGMRVELDIANKTRQACEFLASKSISMEQVNAMMDILYPLPKVREGGSSHGYTRTMTKRGEVLAQFEKDDSFTDKTFYTFLNANTYLSEHPLHKQARTDNAQVAFENITGSRANWKSKVLGACLLMANGSEVPPSLGFDDGVIDAEYVMKVA